MEKDNLNKTQLVLLVLLSSFVVSLATAIIVVALINQTPPPITNTISKVIKETIGISTSTPEIIQKEVPIIITQENLITKIVEDTDSSVVSVIATKDLPVIEQYFIDPFGDNDLFKGLIPPELLPNFQIPQYRQKGTEKRQVSSGSGFFVSADGLVLTNKHVVEDTKAEYSVIMNNGKKLPARVLARDRLQDIAVLKVDGGDYSHIPLGNSENLKVGQTVIAIGNALGEFQNTVSVGVISGLQRTIVASGSQAGPQTLQSLIQSDAAINPGNSGGPLLDLAGRAIGINTAVASGAENIGFALPINIVKKDISDIKQFGEIKTPFLGVRYILINSRVKEENKLAVDYGALITKDPETKIAVYHDSPAAKAGLKEGDIILEFGGAKIDASRSLAELILQKSVGETVELKILRDGKEMAVSVVLAELPESL